MAASSDTGASRKRIATYGKAVRKRLPDHIAFSTFQELKSTQTALRVSNDPSIAVDKLGQKPSSSPSPTLSTDTDMFDVPSSDDEARTTIQKRRKLQRPATTLKALVAKDSLDTKNSISRQDVRRAAVTVSKDAALKHRNKQQLPFKVLQRESPLAKSSVMEGSPQGLLNNKFIKSDVSVSRKSKDLTKSPPKYHLLPLADIKDIDMQSLSTTPFTTPQQRRSPTSICQDALMTTLGQRASLPDSPSEANSGTSRFITFQTTPAVLTPRGMKMWQGLLGEDNYEDLDAIKSGMLAEQIPHQIEDGKNRAQDQKLPRRRLIDSLAEQSINSKPLLDIEPQLRPKNSLDGNLASEDLEFQDQKLPTAQVASVPTVSANTNATGVVTGGAQALQSSLTKITYSRQRSILVEKDFMKEVSFDIPLTEGISGRTTQKRRGSIPVQMPLQGLDEKLQTEDANDGVAIRTIHELRHAGAQTRFKDEVEDLLELIGSPKQQKSLRRSGLLDLARKMRDKIFTSNFLSNGMDHRLFVHLEQEQDVIAGFAIISLLMIVLDTGITSVAVVQLHQQGISQLLIRLIGVEDNIVSIAKDRKTNMSKSAQLLLSELQQNLLGLKVWNDIRPQSISPRTASLRCLELMVRQSREAGDADGLLSEELVVKLFKIIKPLSDSRSERMDAIDLQLTLMILGSSSVIPIISATNHLASMRDLLKVQLRSNSDGSTVVLLLRLILNITNSSPAASDVFASPDVLHLICWAVIERFVLLSGNILEPERLVLVDHLVLMLVVMINILELSLHAPTCFERFNDNTLDDLVQIFLDNNEKAFETDSVEDSHLNVAVGYLAVLLGYVWLSTGNNGLLAGRQLKNTLQALITCIDEFIGYHKKVDDLFKDDAKHNPQAGLTNRLQNLVDNLKKGWT